MRLKFWSAEGAIRDYRYSQICRLCDRGIMPKLDGILESAIHTEDMARSRAFYEGVLGLEPIYSDNRLSAYDVAGRDVLFRKGTTQQPVALPSCTIPGHGGDGALHVAFAVGKDELDRRTSLHVASPSKGVMIGRAVAAAFISATLTGTFWNSQRRDCGRCVGISRVRH